MEVVIRKEANRIGGCIAGFLGALVLVVMVFSALSLLPEDHYLRRKLVEESVIGGMAVRLVPRARPGVEGLPVPFE